MAPRSSDPLRRELRAAGLRATAARVAVLGTLRAADRPLSHGDLVAELGTETWNRTTLYRNLVDLERAGLVRRTRLGGREWRFEDPRREHSVRSHPHFVCTACEKVVCLPALQVTPRSTADCRRALRQGRFEIQFHGVCDACAEDGS